MRIFGLEITRAKAIPPALSSPHAYQSGGWWSIIREPFSGAWQQNVEYRVEDVLAYAPVYACATLIASDIGKLRIKLTERDSDGIWSETPSAEASPFYPVLEKPNAWQTRIKFLEQWILSKLLSGNTYALKARDQRGIVTSLTVLDPSRVKPLQAPDGSIYYQLNGDVLARIPNGVDAIPASEIIHDVMATLYHPLCGVSPITACGLPAIQGLRIQRNSASFFGNGSQPGGILTAPGPISKEDQEKIEQAWQENYTGDNAGKVAVLGNGLKYEAMSVNATDAQLIEQLKWTAEQVCMAFHIPPYMIGAAPPPPYNNIEALNQQYYAQCLQNLIESIELLLDEGLALPNKYGTELDLDALLRMDTSTRVKAAADSIGSGAVSPNEARRKYFNLGPVVGGDTPYMQHQDYSLAALAKRDAMANPFAPGNSSSSPSAEGQAGSEASGDIKSLRVVKSVSREIARERLRLVA